MKILYDHQAFTGMRFGGIARYHFELMNYYSNHQDPAFDLALRFSNNEYINGAKFSNHQTFSHFLSYLTTNKVMSFLNRANSSRMLRKSDFDIFHPTYYNKYFLNHLGSKPFVLTFHDCTNEKFHEKYASLGGDLFTLKQELLNRASKVIAVSEHAKNEMLHYFKVDEQKVDVVYHGTSFCTIEQENIKSDFQKKDIHQYLLYVGNRSDFKNFNLYLKSIAPLLKQQHDIKLVCAGGKKFSHQEKEFISTLGLTGQVKFEEITSDSKLKALFMNALAFVFPSLNEGFGIPILEAFASDCPMILSNASCFPEIAQNAAIYFDPSNSESMLECTKQIIQDEELRNCLVQKGRERIKDFSLEKTAIATLKTYQKTKENY